MAHDPDLAERVRALLRTEPDVREQRMFGGLAFLLGGTLAVSVHGRSGLLVRVGTTDADGLLAGTDAEQAVMGQRVMAGWLVVDTEHLHDDDALAGWVARGARHARSLPR